MADKFMQLMVAALRRAAAEPAGIALFGGKQAQGLFAPSTLARQAAQRCKDEGLVRVVRTEVQGKTPLEICSITDKGLSYLLDQASPREVLEDLVRALEGRQEQLAGMQATLRQTQESIDGLRTIAQRAVQGLKPSAAEQDWLDSVPRKLAARSDSGAGDDFPLPELFRALRATHPDLTIGQFHDGLRQLHDDDRLYLHPWTGPLYDLPEPPLALLVGHEVAYYASPREGAFVEI